MANQFLAEAVRPECLSRFQIGLEFSHTRARPVGAPESTRRRDDDEVPEEGHGEGRRTHIAVEQAERIAEPVGLGNNDQGQAKARYPQEQHARIVFLPIAPDYGLLLDRLAEPAV